MIKRDEITGNINSEMLISREYQKESRYGICKYITDMSSIAMVYVNYFFIKKSLFEYDKLVIACAAILLACKYQNIQGKFDQLCRRYLESNSKIMGQVTSVLKVEDIHKIKEKICHAELTLLKSVNFNINLDLPNEFIYVYSAILYPENEDDMVQFSIKVLSDSYYTYAPLLYKNYVIAIASIIIAASYLSLPSILDKNFKGLQHMKRFLNESPIDEEDFNRKLLSYENKSFHLSYDLMNEKEREISKYFDELEIHNKIHPYMELSDLKDTIKMIMEFYEDMKKEEIII